ncbi:type II toxin-antitoxin system PemK/MazF family toxin [Natrinema versiforme]|uniref:Type II toxin-antitoxin system PemK/MazF family toxin n=1 Tax=Natrinema versiforme TaxID=88724 RepID=A0A4P8WKG0_9EURY|nr:type II toxin-antitoxin system PemK/MazF family toxin [Natrinema versiforme]QCS43980.1 type II toxin-antitoxin system PemK/MazF family toxin [Natrinema versiforme]
MSYERGDVVVALDPFRDGSSGRPFLLIDYEKTPFHGEQYISLSLTTRTWYEERIPLDEADWEEGGAPRSSSIMPWSVNSIDSDLIESYQGRLRNDIVDEATAQLSEYVHW